jgi:cation diffusion facilitator CzcD-associated flavoprotein CzcO
MTQHHRIAIVGTGFSGLGMAIRLKQEGEEDFVLLERADDIGGTWRDNTYPGCRCDVPSHLYSFSFAPNPNWSSTFSPQAEILDYLKDCAERYGVMPHIRFDTELESAAWDEDEQVWSIETSSDPLTADFLVAAQGPLSEPSLPEVSGIDSFEGTAFHSAEWNHEHDLTGERVAVVGTGASAIQFVPEIQPKVANLHVFQRTAPWVIPHRNRPLRGWERALYRLFPPAQLAMRAGIYWARELFVLQFRHRRIGKLLERIPLRHLHDQIEEPELRRRLTPDYRMGCKRILPADEWYPALAKPNVEVITGGVTEIRPNSVVAEDGSEREVDTIIFGTGFHVTDVPIANRVVGRDGRTLAEVWQGSMQAYKGTTVAGYPNLFFLVGPNTGLGHTSIVFMIESQVEYVLDALRAMRRRGAHVLEVREDAQAAYNAELDRMTGDTVWVTGGCTSYYIDSGGHNSALWPTYTWPFRRRLREFDATAYALGTRVPRPTGARQRAAYAGSTF